MDKESLFNTFSKKCLFKKKCNSCKLKVKNYISFYKIDRMLIILDYVSISYIYFNFCKNCFLELEQNDILHIKNEIGVQNKLLKSKCKLCKNKTKSYIKIEKGFSKKICHDCINKIFGIEYSIVIIEKEQELTYDEIDNILLNIYSSYDMNYKYEKGEFKEEIEADGFYFFIKTETIEDAEKDSQLLNKHKIKNRIITYDEFLNLFPEDDEEDIDEEEIDEEEIEQEKDPDDKLMINKLQKK